MRGCALFVVPVGQVVMRLIWFIIVSVLVVKVSHAQCGGNTCTDCVLSGFDCAWCSKANFLASRCQQKKSLTDNGCEDIFIEEQTSYVTIIKNDSMTDDNQPSNNAVQIQPQRIRIATRPGKTNTIPMTFRAANNVPLDLYFLFDNSKTMEEHLTNLAKLSSDIGMSLNNLSINYMIGYGVFQDKVILPFTDTAPERVKFPCGLSDSKCAPPFEFKHMLNMTRNITEFRERISSTLVSENLDRPEGSLDAIIQAITCKSQIGWRTSGRKLLIFASNDGFHFAGDGRLGGVVIPNDGQCYLDIQGRYTQESELDYPSISQIADIVVKNEVQIIFAVTSDQVILFNELSQRIPNSKVEILANPNDDGNRTIKDIIENKYKEMLTEVEITHNRIKGIDIEIRATSEHCQKKGTSKCKSLEKHVLIGSPITFEVDVTVTACPSRAEDVVKEVIMYPANMNSDTLVMEINIICECSCSTDQSKWEPNSKSCTQGNGTLICGLCDCQPGRFGQFCECNHTNNDTSNNDCTRPGSNSTEQCSDAGICEWGVCKCDEGYSGPHCQCYNQSCGYFLREICGAPNGHCVCGECVCQPGYTGSACECSTSNSTCVYDDTVCNDAGTCECGECKCSKGYIGTYCENCFLCGDTACDIPAYYECTECAVSDMSEECPESCPEVMLVDTFDNVDGSVVCAVIQPSGCFISYRIITTDANITIVVQKTATCPDQMTAKAIHASVFGGMVVLGFVLLLLWKILTSIYDRIKYSKFQKHQHKCKWAQQHNPFFKGTTSTYRSPLLETTETEGDDKYI